MRSLVIYGDQDAVIFGPYKADIDSSLIVVKPLEIRDVMCIQINTL
jgi:hypothetical protein